MIAQCELPSEREGAKTYKKGKIDKEKGEFFLF